MDTLRADRLGAYGHSGGLSPGLDALARGAVLFEDAISAASWTLPSFASLFTSRDARGHGLLAPEGALPQLPTFAEALQGAGYRTAAFTEGPFFDRRYGLSRGFGRYEPAPAMRPPERLAEDGLRWLDSERGRPRLLFLHTLAVHAPYHAPPPYRHMSDPGYEGVVDRLVLDNYFLAVLNRVWTRHWGPPPTKELAALIDRVRASPRDMRHIASHYEDGAARTDGALAALWDGLKERGLYDEALIVVLSDHGEELGERGAFRHNHSVAEAVIRVPLLLKLPRGRGAGRRVPATVSLLDVAPTLLEAAGAPPLPGAQGRSLLPLAAGAAAPPRGVLFTASDTPARRHALFSARDGRWKLVRSLEPPAQALYDLAEDPGETRDLAAKRPEQAARLSAELDRWLAAAPAPARGAPRDEAHVEALRAAGYLP